MGYFAFSNGLVYIVCHVLLFKLWYPIWSERIWPMIQLPELAFLSEWTTLDPRIPDYEISVKLISRKIDHHLARAPLIKTDRHQSYMFVAVSTFVGIFGIFIGQRIRGVYIFYLMMVSIVSTPMIFADHFLRAVREIEAKSEIKVTVETIIPEPVESSEVESDVIEPYTESESSDDECPRFKKSDDPNPEPTWMEDFSYNVSQTMDQFGSSVKSQIEEAISSKIERLKPAKKQQSSSDDSFDFVVLNPDDADGE